MTKKNLLVSASLFGLLFSSLGLAGTPEPRKKTNTKQALFEEKHRLYLEHQTQKEELQKKVWTKEMESKVPKDSYEAFEQKRARHQVQLEQLNKDSEVENSIESSANAVKKVE